MLISKVAKRYAQGLLQFTTESGKTEEIFSEMKDLKKVLTESKDLNQFFHSPFIDSRKKISIAGDIFKNFSDITKNLITLVIRHGREKYLKDIAEDYINKLEDLNGVQRISLTTATQLTQNSVDRILNSTDLVNHNNKFEVKMVIDPNTLGGYILRVGDQQIDASVRTKLSQVKKEFQLN